MKKCNECLETFNWDDHVVNVEDQYFHKECVTLYPMGYIAFANEQPIGEVEYDDMACLILNDGDYLESDEG